MQRPLLIPLLAFIQCTPLEERVEIFDAGWCADSRSGSAACILDGDTFDLVGCERTLDETGDDDRVRLHGIQAPEVAHGSEPTECFGDEATEFLSRLLQGRTLRLEFDEECYGYYNRTLAWVFISGEVDDPLISSEPDDPLREELKLFDGIGLNDDGSFDVLVNELMVRAGYARIYEAKEDGRYYDRLQEAELQAAHSDQGLWTACDG
jgi:endonuclease YncB( thermonuclease family)